jgi:hypothetical protein
MRFRFTIRDLLWLTLVVAVLFAWRFSRIQPVAGRYQRIDKPNSLPLIFDTATGRVWELDHASWVERPGLPDDKH